MAKKDLGGFPTPDVIDPPESMRVTLCVPKNRDHLSAFFGALWELTMWNSWQPDAAHTGKELAAVWYRYWLSWNRNMSDEECDEMACCPPEVAIRRFNPDTGRPEVSYDDGVTWSDDPDDPENLVQLYPPLVTEGGDKTKCDAATNASQHISELITATGENLDTAGDVFELVVGIAGAILALVLIIVSAGALTAPITAIATAIWAAGTAAFELGVDLYNAYWTTDKQDAILCALYCHIGENGQFTEEQYQEFRSEIKETLPASPAFDIVMTAINAVGARGLSQMASYGAAALADCASCEPCGAGCADSWVVTFGNEISRTTTSINVEAVFNAPDGVFHAQISSGNQDVCCWANWATPTLEANRLYYPCGLDSGSAIVNGVVPPITRVWLIDETSGSGFTINYVLTSAPT